MTSPFDHRPDHELGDALRAALDAGDDHAFAAQVSGAARELLAEPQGSWWSVLEPWARPGMMAALVLIAAMSAWLGARVAGGNGASPLGDPLLTADEQLGVPMLFVSDDVPDVDIILGTALGR
jgi:hypothetical protein